MTKNKDIIQRAKPDIVKMIKQKTGMKQTKAKIALEAVLESIQDCLAKGESVGFLGFGSFSISERAARDGRNPQTGEKLKIPASKAVKFSAGKDLKEAVNAKKKK